TLSAAVSGAYFFRTDKITYTAPDLDTLSDSPLLGAEIYGGLSWVPFHDTLFSLGGGLFLPQTGKVFADNARIKYRLELTASVSL
ncbi:MAG: hypothetical protein LBQ46_03410, partial [Treponema sp.]|nr:hypothetical protein [Treponema sp.]